MPNAGAAESPAAVPAAPGVSSADPVAMGEALVKEYACTACHAVDATKLVGPGWGGLYASQVLLADGSEVTADDAYLAESIRSPDAKIVEGYATGTMPAYETMLNEGQVDAIVAYIRALQGARP